MYRKHGRRVFEVGDFITCNTTVGTRQGAIISKSPYRIKGASGSIYNVIPDDRIVLVSNPPRKCSYCGLPLGDPCVGCKKNLDDISKTGMTGAEAGQRMKDFFFKLEPGKKHTIRFLDDVISMGMSEKEVHTACEKLTEKEKNMKIYHAAGFDAPNNRNKYNKTYDGYEQFFGHILTIRDNRTHDRFAHLFSPEGTRVHHLDYPTFKEFAEILSHEYLPLNKQEFKRTKKNLEAADVGQLMLFKSIVNRRLDEESAKDENFFMGD